MKYFTPTSEIKRARNINRIVMIAGYIIGNIAWVLWLNRIFGSEEGAPSRNMDGLVYLPALFATPIIALLAVPPFVWMGGIWQTKSLKKALKESNIVIWVHTQPVISLILSAISLVVFPIIGATIFFLR